MSRTLLASILVVLTLSGIAWSADEKPKDSSSEASLIGGRLTFTPPPDDAWARATNVNADDAAAYGARDEKGAIAIQVLPADAEMTPQMGGAVVRSLRDAHKKANQNIVYGPKVEPDKRFALKVHEKYQVGEKTADELHLYRNVGPRVVMVTVNAWVTDDAAAKPVHQAGEDVLASAKWAPSAKKK
ncbi:MAG TPA: hypothetical protein VGI81_15935 [Tepidisphaeraceae bacterium]